MASVELVGVALLGFTLSYDGLARSSQALDAQGTLTTALSLVVIGASLTALWWLRARQASRGSDAGKGLV